MRHRDPAGHYAALNVHADASSEEILLSYRLLKQAFRERQVKLDIGAIQEAYEVLSDAESKAAYDGLSRPAPAALPVPGRNRVSSPLLLLGLVLVLMIVLAVVHGPEIRYSMVTFQQGDQLYLHENGRFLGSVSAFESQHLFHNGARAEAYLLRRTDEDPGSWYPAGDLARIAKVR